MHLTTNRKTVILIAPPRIKTLDACAGPWAKEAGISDKNYAKRQSFFEKLKAKLDF